MQNFEIRQAAKKAGVHLWEVAERYGLSDGNFSRKLRRELPDADKAKILEIIRSIELQKQSSGEQ